MKKLLLLLAFCALQTTSWAYDYQYLAFTTSDGTVTTVDVDNLEITVSGSNLVVVNSSDNKTFTLSDLTKMYFTNTASTAISEVSTAEQQAVSVFTTAGVSVGKFSSLNEAKQKLQPGLYIIQQGSNTFKMTVK
ncbi:MAG: hypothetical protein ACOYJG_01680 [Prevotella sp.]|jgi:hypothetical protein